MALIIDEKQLERLRVSKRRRRRGRSVKPSAKEQRAMSRRMGKLWIQILKPTSERIKQMVRDNAPVSEIAIVIEAALNESEFRYDVEASDIIDLWRKGVDDDSRKALGKGLGESLSVDISALVDTPVVKEALAAGSTEAAGLIKSIPGDYLKEVARAITDNYAGVSLPEDRSLLQQIIKIGKVSKKRAKFIARDQTSKLTTLVNKNRQMSIGVSTYIWRTVKDTHVVGNPSGIYPVGNKAHGDHYSMEGVYCEWNDNTTYSTNKGKTWKNRKADMPKSIPGWEIQCRCYAEPVIDLDEILENSQSS